jgi:hypothetical protein
VKELVEALSGVRVVAGRVLNTMRTHKVLRTWCTLQAVISTTKAEAVIELWDVAADETRLVGMMHCSDQQHCSSALLHCPVTLMLHAGPVLP